MNNAPQTFRMPSRPRFFLGSALLDLIDANPVLSTALVVASVAGLLAILVLA